MNHVNLQTLVKRAWTGSVAASIDITDYNYHNIAFEVTANITTAAVFKFQSAPASTGDPCVPGSFTDVEAIATCMGEVLADGTLAQVTIPVGTLAGALCSAALPCRPDVFLRLASVSGDVSKVIASHVLTGPHT